MGVHCGNVPRNTKIMSNVSCFKRLNCLFLLMTVEVTLQLRLKNAQYADQLMHPHYGGLVNLSSIVGERLWAIKID